MNAVTNVCECSRACPPRASTGVPQSPTADNFVDNGHLHLQDFEAAFHYTTGDASSRWPGGAVDRCRRRLPSWRIRSSRSYPILASGIDAEYVAWYGKFLDLAAPPSRSADRLRSTTSTTTRVGDRVGGAAFEMPQRASNERHTDERPQPGRRGWSTSIELVDPVRRRRLQRAPCAAGASVSNTSNSVAISSSTAGEPVPQRHSLQETVRSLAGRWSTFCIRRSTRTAYDLVLQCGGVTRHVQLKTKRLTGKTATYKLSTLLYNQPAACVVVLEWDLPPGAYPPRTLTYRWFGGRPHEPIPNLGEKIAKHTKGDSQGIKTEKPTSPCDRSGQVQQGVVNDRHRHASLRTSGLVQ